MAYYLKKTKLKGRTYLSIDESFYSHDKKGTAHKCFKSLGSVETWKKKGVEEWVLLNEDFKDIKGSDNK